MNITTLPVFRVAGLTQRIDFVDEQNAREQLWHAYHASDLNAQLPAFSPTVYCVLHQYDENGYTATLGRLLSNDATLPTGASDVWILPQQYAVCDLSDNTHQTAWQTWQNLRADTSLSRAMQMDFESYPSFGMSKIYVGLTGKAEIVEESL